MLISIAQFYANIERIHLWTTPPTSHTSPDNRSAAGQLTSIADARSAPAAFGLGVASESLKNQVHGLSEMSADAFAAA